MPVRRLIGNAAAGRILIAVTLCGVVILTASAAASAKAAWAATWQRGWGGGGRGGGRGGGKAGGSGDDKSGFSQYYHGAVPGCRPP